MDDLLGDFLTETREHLDIVDLDLVRLEQVSSDPGILDRIFRLVHTVKGTCGFLGLPRLESLAHAAENLMGKFRDGAPVASDGVSAILASIDRIKLLLGEIEKSGSEPAGSDAALIADLERLCEASMMAPGPLAPPQPGTEQAVLDELERVFRETPGPELGRPGKPREARLEPAKAAEPAMPAAAAGAEVAHDAPNAPQTIRVSVETLDRLMTTVSELVLARNQLLALGRRLDCDDWKAPLQRLSSVTAELQQNVIKTRMQPVGNAWQKIPRQVRDLSRELDKKIELDLTGADTELDRQVLEMIKDPLTHLVRNACDHGLEARAERQRIGKPEAGTIRLNARHEGGYVLIEIADDGKGLDPNRIAAKAVERGLVSQAEIQAMSESEIWRFVFRPGFSTAETVTHVSGRGVGLDVVRTNIETIGGSIEINSEIGIGTSFTLKIPLTLAIVQVLVIEACGQRFAMPQLGVMELVRVSGVSPHRLADINGAPVLELRNKLLPVVRLGALLGLETATVTETPFVIVVRSGRQEFGLAVERVVQSEEIVVKPLPELLRDVAAFSGATILGDGGVILILDPNGLAQALSKGAVRTHMNVTEDMLTEGEEERDAHLLFRVGSSLKAVPLTMITRLEEISTDAIQRCNGYDVIHYRDYLLRLISFEDADQDTPQSQRPVLVFSDNGRSVGLMVDEIVNVVKDALTVDVTVGRPGRIGSTIIGGRAVELVDLSFYLASAFEDGPRPAMPAERRILLVDDSMFFRNMLAPLLDAAGYAVTLASSAEEALGLRAEGQTFDVIVSDIEMPEMDGIGFAEAVRSDRNWGGTPLIALSSQASPGLVARTKSAGFVDHVGKFDRQGLLDSIGECHDLAGRAAA